MAIAKVIYKTSAEDTGTVWMDTTQKTVTAGAMLNGVTALKNDGTGITGNIPSKSSSDLTVSGATVTAPAGFYDSVASKSVSTATQATPSISVNSSTGLITASATQTAGYVSDGTKSSTEQLSTQTGKTVTPTESEQTAVVAGKFTTGAVKVAGISSTYVGSGIDQNGSDDLTVSGATVTARSGYYAEDASKSVAAGTAGTPTATKGTVSNHAVSITPSVTNTTGYITGGTKNGTAVSVSASELVSGTKTISSSGTTDVTNYASASVAAGSATTPATTITANPSISVSSSGLITATASASQSVTPTVTEGYVASGTAGTVSVSGSNTEQLSTQAATTITPSTSQQTAVAAGKYTTGAVVVDPIPSQYIVPSGTLAITENDTGIDVSQYASVDVAVPAQVPTGVKYIWTDVDGEVAWDVSGYAKCSVNGAPLQDNHIRLWIELTSESGLSVTVNLTGSGVNVDWGDETSETTSSNSPAHTYLQTGKYIIDITVGSVNAQSFIVGQNSESQQSILKFAEYYSYTVYGNVFRNCTALKNLYITPGVKKIGTYFAYYCIELTQITLPSSITAINSRAFSNVATGKQFTATIYASSPPTLSSDAFDASNLNKIYVPSASVDAYKAATNWSTYADCIEAMPE